MKVKRGIKVMHDLGRVVEYDGKKEMSAWSTKECNQYVGTDSTIFPPFLTKEEGIAAFAPDLCRYSSPLSYAFVETFSFRSIVATFVEERDFRGIRVNRFVAGFGDMSTDPKLKCYCPKPDFCLKKGVHDLTNCVGAPIVTSLPHFWDGDESYQKGVRGLHPNEHEHGIELIFESVRARLTCVRLE